MSVLVVAGTLSAFGSLSVCLVRSGECYGELSLLYNTWAAEL